jgi:threonine aldolase
MFGMEAALYSPSGTMSNQIAIKAHTQPGDEVICDFSSHVYQYEGEALHLIPEHLFNCYREALAELLLPRLRQPSIQTTYTSPILP